MMDLIKQKREPCDRSGKRVIRILLGICQKLL